MISLRHPLGWLLRISALVTFVYLLGPLLVIVAASLSDTGYLAFPPQGLSLRWYRSALADARYVDGFLVSLRLGATVALISLVVGTSAAVALTRFRFPGRALIEAFFLSPLVLPGLVLAVALTLFFASNPILPPGMTRLVAAHLVVGVPLVLRVMLPVLKRVDQSVEEAAQNLGATPLQAFFLVTLPALRPGLFAAAALAFIFSFDEVEMALFVGSVREAPLTVVLYGAAQMAFDPTVAAVSSLLILLALVLMVAQQLYAQR
ncbi:ABC transporter permease [Falsiroseomonas sp. HW251]|uniref:ABC transporter permease n=1 Tax=Falsiroseomonas sp. HW251 TaxID=3390998 RepID=UPI003D311514